MIIKKIKTWLLAGLVAVSLPMLSASHTLAQGGKAAGASTNQEATNTRTQDEQLTNQEVNQSIRQNFRLNTPFSRNKVVSPNNTPLTGSYLHLNLGPNTTYDALGNSPVNNNSGAYNPKQAVNMPQSSIIHPPLPYKNGGTYYQANDSLARPPIRGY